MSVRVLVFLFITFCTQFNAAYGADFPYDKYEVSTLNERDKEQKKYIDPLLADGVPLETTRVVLSAQRFSASVKYIEGPRLMKSEEHDWLVKLGATLPFNESFWSLFTHEIAVSEGENVYWLPIQGLLVESLVPDLAPSIDLTIYFVNLGSSGGKPLYLITAVTTH